MGDASATLVFGLPVDPFELLYRARAWTTRRIELAYLDALISGKLKQAEFKLPSEILSIVRDKFWKEAVEAARCRSWAYYGKDLDHTNHPPSCCSAGRDLAERKAHGRCGSCREYHIAYRYSPSNPEGHWEYADMYLESDRWEIEEAFVRCFRRPCAPASCKCQVGLRNQALIRESHTIPQILYAYLDHYDLVVSHCARIGDYEDRLTSGFFGERGIFPCIISTVQAKTVATVSHEVQELDNESAVQFEPYDYRALHVGQTELRNLAGRDILPCGTVPIPTICHVKEGSRGH